ncbi:MAG: helicase-related protein [Beijerinckiaceae bacterium]
MNLQTPSRHMLPAAQRARRVSAVLGPTNTGKTHLAIERMLGHSSGIIGLPLRLLAREVYNRVVEKAGAESVALITGEEKIKPPRPKYWIATVEAMPRDLDVAFVAIDEIQLAADLDRGHTFTDRLLNRRGIEETLIIGAETMRPVIERLMPGVRVVTRPRLSHLAFAGERKLSRLPRRSAIVAFSAEEVYAIAELIRRQRGGAAVVLGALSPRTRNAQVEMYQNGDVDYIVATDAVGMGLNLDVDHVAFAGDKKFDGWQYRRLNPAELGQIAGRAGRHIRDGTFGTTGRCAAFEAELAEAIENHRFDAVPILQWRNSDLDFSSIAGLQHSLEREPGEPGLTRAPLAEDVMVLDILARAEDVQRQAKTRADIGRLWDACQVPDYRKLSPSAHAELVHTLFSHIVRAGRIPDQWFQTQLAMFDRTDGDIDVLSARIAQVRTFNYIANRPDWLGDPEHWQNVTRQVEDSLSDALHERLAHRFVDRRTSVLMRRLRENAMLESEITATGDVMVEGQHVGVLQGFRFTADPQAEGEAQKTINAAAQKVLAAEIENRANRFGAAVDEAFVLSRDGSIRWLGEVVAKIASGDHLLKPQVRVLADEQLTGAALEGVQRRLDLWLQQHVRKLLGPVLDLEAGEGLEGLARGIAYQISEALGVLDRSRAAGDLRELDQAARGTLRKLGVRFGAYHLYLPQLLKPAPRTLAAQLWALKHDTGDLAEGLEEVAHLASSGRTSFAAKPEIPKDLYLAAGFRVSGTRAVRVDILERLADLIRPAVAYRPGQSVGEPPAGTADRDGFVVTVAMTSLAGCSGEDFAGILRSLGYVLDRRKGPAITAPIIQAAPTAPVNADAAPAASEAETAGAEPEAGQTPDDAAELDARSEDAAAQALEETAAAAASEAADAGVTGDVVTGDAAVAVVSESAAENAADSPPEPEPAAAPQAPAETGKETVAAPEASAAPEAAVEASAEAASEATPAVEAAEETEQAANGAAEAAAAEAEEQLIEVWRPRRAGPPGQRRQGQHARGQQARGQQGRGQQEGGQHRGRRGPPGESQPGAAVAGPEGGQAVRSGAERFNRRQGEGPGPRRERPQGEAGDRRDQGGNRGGGRNDGRRDGRNDGRSGKGPNRRDDQPRGARTFSSGEKPRGRNAEPDPNSPFAKLLALKQAMEKKDGD